MAVRCSTRSRALLGLAALLCALPVLNAAPMIFGEGDELSAIFNVARTRLPNAERDQHGSSHHASSANEPYRLPPSPLASQASLPSGGVSENWIHPPDQTMHYGQAAQQFSGDRYSVGTSEARMTHHATQQGMDTSYLFAPPHRTGHDQAQAGPSQMPRSFSQLYHPLDLPTLTQVEEWNAMHHAQPDTIDHRFQWDLNSNAQQPDMSSFGHGHPSQPILAWGHGVEAGSQAPSDPYHELRQPRRVGRPKGGSLRIPPSKLEGIREVNEEREKDVRAQVERAESNAFQRIASDGANVQNEAQLEAHLSSLSKKSLQDLGDQQFSRRSWIQEQGSLLQTRKRLHHQIDLRPIRIATAVQRALYQELFRRAMVEAEGLSPLQAEAYRMKANPKVAHSQNYFGNRYQIEPDLLGSAKGNTETRFKLPDEALKISMGPYKFHVATDSRLSTNKAGVDLPVTASPTNKEYDIIDMGLLVVPPLEVRSEIAYANNRAK